MGIVAKNISQFFGSPPIQVLHNVSLEIKDGEFTSITGRSGSGKSTLLYVLSTLDELKSGEIWIDGAEVTKMNVNDRHRFRNENLGFVFQFHYLLPELSVLENVLLPAMKNKQQNKRKDRALWLLEQFGLSSKFNRFPSQLSGGEQQRVAIARALIMEPRYLFADEPTGNLDSANGEIVLELIQKINSEQNTTVLMVTHDSDFALRAKRQIQMVDGKVL